MQTMLSGKAAAAKYNISYYRWMQLCAEGRGPKSEKIHARLSMYDPADVEEWIAAGGLADARYTRNRQGGAR